MRLAEANPAYNRGVFSSSPADLITATGGVASLLGPLGFLLGLIFGSFLNVCVSRLPEGRSVVSPGSACPHCGHAVRWYHNVPLLSWLLLRARCRDCAAPIPARYILIELATAILFCFCAVRYGFTLSALQYAVFGWLLLGLIATDAETRLLPDAMTLSGVAIGLGFSFADATWREKLLGVAVSAGFLYLTRWIYLRLRHVEGLGLGDVKLIALIAAFLPPRSVLMTLLVASVVGALAGVASAVAVWIKRLTRWKRRGASTKTAQARATIAARLMMRTYPLPFGVFLGAAALAVWLWAQYS